MSQTNRLKIEDMLKTQKVKDNKEDSGYSMGLYNDKKSMSGFYLKAERGSLLERIEQMAKAKFQLENDPENYVQEARVELWLSIIKYYDKFGYDEDIKPDGFVYTDVKYKLMDMAKLAKSNVSTCDRKTGKYYINKIESFEQKFIEENDKIKNQKDEREMCVLYGLFTEDTIPDNSTTSQFVKWFNDIKEFILTRKQIDYLNGDVIIKDSSGEWRLRKNILKRVEEAYANDKIRVEKTKKIEKELKSINYLLDFKDEKDLIERIRRTSKRNNDDAIIQLYESLRFDYCSILAKIINDETYNDVKNKDFFYGVISILTEKEIYLNNAISNLNTEGEFHGIQ